MDAERAHAGGREGGLDLREAAQQVARAHGPLDAVEPEVTKASRRLKPSGNPA